MARLRAFGRATRAPPPILPRFASSWATATPAAGTSAARRQSRSRAPPVLMSPVAPAATARRQRRRRPPPLLPPPLTVNAGDPPGCLAEGGSGAPSLKMSNWANAFWREMNGLHQMRSATWSNTLSIAYVYDESYVAAWTAAACAAFLFATSPLTLTTASAALAYVSASVCGPSVPARLACAWAKTYPIYFPACTDIAFAPLACATAAPE